MPVYFAEVPAAPSQQVVDDSFGRFPLAAVIITVVLLVFGMLFALVRWMMKHHREERAEALKNTTAALASQDQRHIEAHKEAIHTFRQALDESTKSSVGVQARLVDVLDKSNESRDKNTEMLGAVKQALSSKEIPTLNPPKKPKKGASE